MAEVNGYNADEFLEKQIALGGEVEHFFRSDLGQYLIQRAEDEMEDAVRDLRKHDPYDAKGITELQNRIFRCESILDWLSEAIQTGETAMRTIDQPEE